jgi:hypothetical protein
MQNNFKWFEVAHKLALKDPYGARDLLTYIGYNKKISFNTLTEQNKTGIRVKINSEVYKEGAIESKGSLTPDIIYEFQSEEKDQILENILVIELQRIKKLILVNARYLL